MASDKVTIELKGRNLVLHISHGPDPWEIAGGPDAQIWNDGSSDQRYRSPGEVHNVYMPGRVENVPRETADLLVEQGHAEIIE